MTAVVEESSCNLENVNTLLDKGLIGDEDVDMACYIEAYKELYNFFVVLGKAFQFVASDVDNKIKILEEHKKNEPTNFATISTMIEFEMSSKMLNDPKFISGSRTLLRLHRGLDFVQQFLAAVHTLEDNVGVGGVCKGAYDKTLGNFHPWAIRSAASIAMKFLPTKKNLICKMTDNDPQVAERLHGMMPQILKKMGDTYDRVDQLYTKHNLHNLK